MEKTRDIELLIVGRGPFKTLTHRRNLRSSNLAGRVKLYDWAPRTRSSISTMKPQYYSAHHAIRTVQELSSKPPHLKPHPSPQGLE